MAVNSQPVNNDLGLFLCVYLCFWVIYLLHKLNLLVVAGTYI